MEDVRHLGGRLAVRAGVGHGEGRGDAFRREEEIAGLCAEPAVEIDGESIAAFDGFGLIGSEGQRAAQRRKQPGRRTAREEAKAAASYMSPELGWRKAPADRRTQSATFLASKIVADR